MALDTNVTAYDQIELLGLTERGADLPIPSDDTLRDQIIRETFDGLFGGLIKTGLEGEIEPLAHGLATLFQRRKIVLDAELTRTGDKIKALVACHDGSEINETEMEEAQARFLKLREILAAIELMADAAAETYEEQTGDAYIPPAGSRTSKRSHETGAVFEARQLLEQQDRETADRFKIEGVPIVVSGATDWTNVAQVFDTLDAVRRRIKETRNQEIFIAHKGSKGAELIAARWAKARGLHQARFDPRWSAHKRAAPFKANDEMLDDKFAPAGVVLFGGSGVALNLGQKAEDKGVKVMHITEQPVATK